MLMMTRDTKSKEKGEQALERNEYGLETLPVRERVVCWGDLIALLGIKEQ